MTDERDDCADCEGEGELAGILTCPRCDGTGLEPEGPTDAYLRRIGAPTLPIEGVE